MIRKIGFKLVRRVVTQGDAAAVEVEVGTEVVGFFQPSFFQAGKRAATKQQSSVERTPASLRQGVPTRA